MNASFLKRIAVELEEIRTSGLFKSERIITSAQGAEIMVNDKKVLNFCANNYLGLSSHPKVIEAAHKAIDARGYGMSSVRFICGTEDIHRELEQKIAVFLGTEDSILYAAAFDANALLEYSRNRERYSFLRWAQTAFEDFRVVPPDTGIVHQINLEYLASVVFRNAKGDAYPDTLVGTDSHTTMVNGLGVVGWGVGGIEAEAAMLGQPISMLLPEVLGFRLPRKNARGLHRNRPGAHGHPNSAQEGSSRQIRRVLRKRPEPVERGRSRHRR